MRGKELRSAGQAFTVVGAPSVIMIFVILCLTCFAALSLASANAEMRLAARLGANTAAWYAADAEAQVRLKRLDELIAGGVLSEASPAEALAAERYLYAEEEGEAYVFFYTQITEYTALETRVRLAEGGAGFTLTANRTVVTGELKYTELPFIWNGEMPND